MATTYKNTLGISPTSGNEYGLRVSGIPGNVYTQSQSTTSYVPNNTIYKPNYITPEYINNSALDAKSAYEKSLAYLIDDINDDYNFNKDILNRQYNKQLADLDNDYNIDARQLYINKMMNDKTLDETLANVGVSTQGIVNTTRIDNKLDWLERLRLAKDSLNKNKDDAKFNFDISNEKLYRDYLNDLNDTKRSISNLSATYYDNYLKDMKDTAYENNINEAIAGLLNYRAMTEGGAEKTLSVGNNKTGAHTDAKNSVKNIKANTEDVISELYNKGLIREKDIDTILSKLGYSK